MPEIRGWVKSVVSTSNPEANTKVIDKFDERELKLEVRTLDNKLDALDSELTKLENRVEKKNKELIESGSSRDQERVKAEMYDIKNNHEAKEDEWFNILREKMATRTVLRAKERLKRKSQSSIRELNPEDFENLADEVEKDLERQNLKSEDLEKLQSDLHRVMTSMGAPDGVGEIMDPSVDTTDPITGFEEDMDGEEILDNL